VNMEAISFDFSSKKLSLAKQPIPKCGKNDVLIKVSFSGICGTDLHILQGEFPCKEDGPIILGHEFSGTVIETGAEVRCVQKGDQVSVDPNNGCNVCEVCHLGNPHFCEVGGINNTIGIFRNGGWAQCASVPDTQVHKLPEKITLKQAALTEPLSCLAHGWDRISPVRIGSNILIVGAGIIGNLWMIALHLQGHRKITVSEPNKARLATVKKHFPECEFVTPMELSPEIHAYDIVIDCSGNAKAIEQAFTLLKTGGKLCIFGVAPPHVKTSLSPFEIYKKELTIVGVNTNPFTFPKAIGLIESLGERYLNYELLGIKTFSLADFGKALEELKKGSIAKAIFELH